MVSVGAVLRRTATAAGTGFLTGAVALVSILLTGRLRLRPRLRPLVDRPVERLIRDRRLLTAAPHRRGLTEAHVYTALRQQGVERLSDVRYMFYETRDSFSTIGWCLPTGDEPPASALAASRPPGGEP